MSGGGTPVPEGRSARAERIFLAALDRGGADRTSFVARECDGDDELRRRVFSLLLVHERTGPLDRLGADAAAMWAEVLDGEADNPMAPDEAQQSRLEPGMRLGRHEIRARIGAGGMGEVFRAIDPRLGREVAIKVIARRIGDHPEALARFESEARAASALNHPNIVTVYDIGEQEGFPYIVMELVEGASLRELLGEPMELERIVELGGQIASGLAAAHARGVVHRDLKPENVLLDRRGTVRILDFGVARFAHGADESTLSLDSPAPSTSAGALIGTIGYMAPEAIRCEPVDARADQFALGAILYEMATGERAFRRPTAAETLVATLHEEPPPLGERAPALPPALAAAIGRCLAKQRERRFADAEEVQRALAAVIRPAPARPRRPSGLPTPATRLVGRRAELHRLQNLVLEARVRLLTVTGTGGSGKTRLAIEAAREMEPSFPGGVYFVPLAAIGEPELALPAVARAVGGLEADGGEELPDLIRAMTEAEGRTLLVLDNFEQVVDAAPSVGELVAACPDLTVLVTSRELLRLSMEHGFPLSPLELPPAGRALPLDELARTPAVALFVERARMADPSFALDAANAEAVAELCRRFDGLPLALALAAARVRMMTPEAMLRRLEDRLSILTGGPRDLPDRQRSLRAAMDWSYGLLTPVERSVFRRLSVFVGGFTLEAAEAVADPFGRLDGDVDAVVESLLDRSLLIRESAAGGEPRFNLLETVREYALDRMQAEEDEAALRRAHAAYFLVLAEEAGAAAGGPEAQPWSERLERERGNVRAALKWAVAEDEGEWGLRLARGLFPFWERGQGISEGRRHLAELLALHSTQGTTPLRAHALFCAGVLASSMNDPPREMHQALALYRELDNLWGQAAALNALGILYTDHGEFDRAHDCYVECLALWERLGESDAAARSLSNFAYVLRKRGEPERSRRLYRDAAAMFRRLGDETGAAWELSHEADVARDQGDPEADALYERALAAFRELEQPWGAASVLVELAEVSERSGEPDVSRARYAEALATFWRLGHQRGVARVLEGLALVSARHGDDAEALRLAGTAAALRERTSGKRETSSERQGELDALREDVRNRLGRGTADALWQEGRETPAGRLVPELLAPAQA